MQPQYSIPPRNQAPLAYEPPQTWAPPSNRPPPFVSNLLNSAPYASSFQTIRPSAMSGPTPSSLSGALMPPPAPRPTSNFHPPPSRQSSGWGANGTDQNRQLPPLVQSPQNGFGHPLAPNGPPPPLERRVYPVDESDDFLENFLDRTTKQRIESAPVATPRPVSTPIFVPVLSRKPSLTASGLNSSPTAPRPMPVPERRPKTPPASSLPKFPLESPDPLALTSSQLPPITPRKRKHEDPPKTPSMKRLQSSDTLRASQAQTNMTPGGQKVFTPKGHEVYVELPRIFKSGATPSSSMKRTSTEVVTPIKSSSSYRGSSSSVFSDVTKTEDSPDELGLRSINSRSTSTVRGSPSKTGDRDDRGDSF